MFYDFGNSIPYRLSNFISISLIVISEHALNGSHNLKSQKLYMLPFFSIPIYNSNSKNTISNSPI
jgi:hypothetical protein